ncbi:MAG: DUF975 family protein [Lachnospiraceae bacterium]|nr:DUF975 family protein [Lachnospiraceae bacterium]
MDYLSPGSLKRIARGQLFGRLGTVIGAFLLQMVCMIPVFVLYFAGLVLVEALVMGNGNLLIGYVAEFVILILSFLYIAVFLYGQNQLYLKLACRQEATVTDLFAGFREGFFRIIALAAAPSVLLSVFFIPVVIAINRMIIVMYTDQAFLDEFYRQMMTAGMMGMDQAFVEDFTSRFTPYSRAITYSGIFAVGGCVLVGILFSQILYLASDYSDRSVIEIFMGNFRVMTGHWLRFAFLVLTFAPWFLLCMMYCTFLAVIWVFPYYKAASANFYIDLLRGGKHPSGSD